VERSELISEARPATASVWRNRDFVRLWVALTVSYLGDFFSLFAIPLLVFTITDSALQTGLTLALGTVPYVVMSPFAGVLIDRVDRRRIMICTRVIEMLLIGSIPLVSAFGWLTLGHIYAVGFLSGCAAVVFGAATLSAVPNLVTTEQLVPANALQQTSLSVCSLVGPPLAGVVVAATGDAVTALAVDAVSFLIAAVLLAMIRRPMQAEREGAAAQGLFADMAEGFRYVWAHRLVRTIALVLFMFNLMLGGVVGQLVVYGSRVLDLDTVSLSLLFAAEGAGTIVGAVIASQIGRRWPLGQIVLVVLPINAVSVVGLALAPNLAVAFTAMAALGAASTVLFVNLLALRQQIVPDRLQGRVNATARAVAVGGAPIGALLAGALVGPLGSLRWVFLFLAGLAMLNALLACFTPLRERSLASADDPRMTR